MIDIQAVTAMVPRKQMLGQILVLPAEKLIYVSNPKAGCSTVKMMLWRYAEGRDLDLEEGQSVHRAPNSPLKPLNKYDPSFLATIDDPAWFRLTFVRSPYPRVLSCYLNKFNNKSEATLRFKQLVRPNDPGGNISFEEFLSFVLSQPTIEMDPHWRPQSKNLFWGQFPYDFVGRLEHFDADVARLGAALSADLGQYSRAYTNHATSAATRLGTFYNPTTIELVQEIYRDDFVNFGYSLDVPAGI